MQKLSLSYYEKRKLTETRDGITTLKHEIQQIKDDIRQLRYKLLNKEGEDEEVLTDEDYAALRETQKRDFYKERQQRTTNVTPSYRLLPRGRGTTIIGP